MFFTLRQQPKLLFHSIVLAIAIMLANLSLVLFAQDEMLKIVLLQLPYPVWSLLAALALFYAAQCSAKISPRLARAWYLLAAGRFLLSIGEVILVVLSIQAGTTPFPSLADGFFLAFYPIFLLGILLLPVQQVNRLAWTKIGLDVSIALLASVLVVWEYWLGPLVVHISDEQTTVQVLSLAYPVGNLVLMWALLMLLYRPAAGETRGPLFLLGMGIAVQIVLACIYGRQSILGTFLSGEWLSIGWLSTNLIFGITGIWQGTSVQTAPNATPTQTEEPAPPPLQQDGWVSYLPYLCAIGAYVLLEATEGEVAYSSPGWLKLTVGLIIVLVLVRQMVTFRENNLLLTQVHKKGLELSRANQELRDTQTLLIHSEKMNALGQMVAGVAHEINNPIAFVNSNIHTLKRMVTAMMAAYTDLEQVALAVATPETSKTVAALHKKADIDFLSEDLDDLVDTSLNGLGRVRKIVDGLRNFSRLDEAEYNLADLREGIESSLMIAQPMLKKRIQVDLDLDRLPLLYCRPAELNQVFLNLILNATHAITDQGTITIAGDETEREVILTFRDTGCGMSPEVMKQIFNPFFTTKPVGVGTGLGLTIAYKIITAGHGGTIDVASEIGQGTTFTIRLPKENPK